MKNNDGFKRTFLGILIVLLAWNGFLTYQLYEVNNKPTTTQTESGKSSQEVVTNFDIDTTRVVEKVEDKVVSVVNYQGDRAMGSGSGVIYKNTGDTLQIITNEHVVNGGNKFSVRLSNGEDKEATLIGSDPLSDLALLEVKEKTAIEPIVLGDSSGLKVGEFVLAIGSPIDLEFANSVTFGVVSGKDRKIPVDINGDGQPDWDRVAIQTDAAINPGNSGGALVNLNGELIGINSMKLNPQQVEGMGFAIPANEVQRVIDEIAATGKVQYPVLGVSSTSVDALNPFQRSYYNIPDDLKGGVFVVEVVDKSPAALGGIKENDVITSFDGKEITDYKTFRNQLYTKKSGDTVSMQVLRAGKTIDLEVTLK
ncbi:S1C family serine protease [Erysipelothrix aquatica]|uniref:S1C family serine protease n=1 Tax=Erysipelothrix aquatica TaxID=2683714 RepID=UPI00135B899B|nr:trypsin-like peptidase domain-containing protein [Erysipelothrix aquatica]